ncbi:MAG: hypothetical protein ABWW69_02120 [Pyrodictiaceae archaeon]
MGRIDPVEAFTKALRAYLRDRGHILYSIAEASRQKRLRVALRGLWRRHKAEETGYEKFMDVVEEIKNCRECLERLVEIGVEGIEEYEGEPYIIVDLEKLKRLTREKG